MNKQIDYSVFDDFHHVVNAVRTTGKEVIISAERLIELDDEINKLREMRALLSAKVWLLEEEVTKLENK